MCQEQDGGDGGGGEGGGDCGGGEGGGEGGGGEGGGEGGGGEGGGGEGGGEGWGHAEQTPHVRAQRPSEFVPFRRGSHRLELASCVPQLGWWT